MTITLVQKYTSSIGKSAKLPIWTLNAAEIDLKQTRMMCAAARSEEYNFQAFVQDTTTLKNKNKLQKFERNISCIGR
jgi:alpha-glucosidase (family GH31 glycosyl hydrolase)